MIGQEFTLVFGIEDAIDKRFIDPVSKFKEIKSNLKRSLYIKEVKTEFEKVEGMFGEFPLVKLTHIIIHGKLDPVPGYGDGIEDHINFARQVMDEKLFYKEDVPLIHAEVHGSRAMHRDIKNHMENTTGGWTAKEEVD